MFKIVRHTLKRYDGTDCEVNIPEGIEIIDDEAFKGNEFVENVIMPESLRVIRYAAFADCHNLKKVSCDKCSGEVRIEEFAFKDCFSLRNLVLPKTVSKIGMCAFVGCGKLRSVKIPETAVVEGSAFKGCNLDHIDFGKRTDFSGIHDSCLLRDGNRCILCHGALENVPEKGGMKCSCCGQVFSYHKMRDWDSFIIDNKCCVEYVGSGSHMPEGVERIARRAFDDKVVGDLALNISDIKMIEDEAFLWCDFALTPVLPRKVKKLGRKVYAASNIDRIMLPETLEYIGVECFSYCENLKEIDIPDNVHTIDERAFAGCTTLEEIRIPKSVRRIGAECFKDCERLAVAYLPSYFQERDLTEIFPKHTKLIFGDSE